MNGRSLLLASIAVVALSSFASPAGASGHAKPHPASYPMKAESYRKMVEAKIDRVRAQVDKKLERAGVSIVRRKEILKMFDANVKDVRAELDRASADGQITQEEATKVNALASGVRNKLRARLAAEKKTKREDAG